MEINHLRATTAAQGAQAGVSASDGAAAQQELKPLFEGGLRVTVAERNVLDDIERVECGEEPSRDEPIARLIRDALRMPAGEMPDFV